MKLHFKKEGHGPALIMAHGIFGSLDNLGAISRILADHFTLYRVDLRNHGASPHADTMSYAEMAGDIIELLDDQGLENAFLFGHSLGGKVCMEVALSYPRRVDKLVVGDIAPVDYPAHHDPILEGMQSVDLHLIKTRADADAQLEEYIPETFVRQYLLKNLLRDDNKKFYWRLNLGALVNCYAGLRLAPGGAGKSFDKPTLFIRGEHSNYIRNRNYSAIHEKFPNARVETIAGGTHWVHAEKADEFARLMIEFLN